MWPVERVIDPSYTMIQVFRNNVDVRPDTYAHPAQLGSLSERLRQGDRNNLCTKASYARTQTKGELASGRIGVDEERVSVRDHGCKMPCHTCLSVAHDVR